MESLSQQVKSLKDSFVVHILIILAIYPSVKSLFDRFLHLSHEDYFSSVIFYQIFKHPDLTLVFLGLALASVIFYFKTSWARLDGQRYFKYLVLFITFIIAFSFSTYDFNLYLNQAHLFDRLFLVGLSLLTFISPAFVPLFLVQALIMAQQFEYPLGFYSWTDKRVVYDALILFVSFLSLRVFLKVEAKTYVFLAVCLIGSTYYYAGLSKILLGAELFDWLRDTELSYLFVNSYLNGWLTFLDLKTVFSLADGVALIDPFLKIFTLITEAGAIFILVRRSSLYFILLACVGLHFGILVTSGIFFWKWVLLDLAFVVLFLTQKSQGLHQLFKPSFALLAIAIIFFSQHSFRPQKFAWYDTKLNAMYLIEALGEDQKTYSVPPVFMSPFDLRFAQNRFFFLNDYKRLTTVTGIVRSNQEAALLINKAQSEADIRAVQDKHGLNFYDKRLADGFYKFLTRYFKNLNERIDNGQLIKQPFHLKHIYYFSTSQYDTYHGQVKVEKLRIRFLETLSDFEGKQVKILKDEILAEVNIIQ